MKQETFQANQSRRWSDVAPSWRRWWKSFDAAAQGVNEWLVEAAGVTAGMRVLDVACGIGEPSLTAARRLGDEGTVIATDFAHGMLLQASGRRQEAEIDNIHFARMDGQSLALQDECVDAAVSRWGIMLIDSPVAAATSIRRVLKPGSMLAAAVWADPADAPFLSIPGEAARAVLGVEAPDPDAPGPFRLSQQGALERVLATAGLEVTVSSEIHAVFEFDSDAHYAEFEGEMSSSLRKTLDQHPPEAQARVWDEIRKRVRAHSGPDGRIRLSNKMWCAAARRPR